ncbi:hypothetical protein TruAng_011434 [Truncatella angustata]|nr:hypothetical protein TruAng_011434 [Truncatella angustata]
MSYLFRAVFLRIAAIIVGGGTAGTALATRLSQSLPDHSILLIEAGPSALEDLKINVPAFRGSTVGGPLDWNLTTLPQAQAGNRVFSVPRGKVLGGSSALNFMLWNRASIAEYDAWGEIGNPGWNWESVSEAMVRSENFTNLNLTEAGFDVRGHEGPIHTTISRYTPETQHLWRASLESLGIPHNIESLSGHPLGVAFHPGSIDTIEWKRSYSANSYLPKSKSNLEVLLSTRVARVDLANSDGKDFVATGVTLEDGTKFHAQREVILSAGSLQSPGLLELSGIGQKAVLKKAGIEQVIDLAGVGENMQDHIRVQLVWQVKDGYAGLDKLIYNSTFATEQLTLWGNREFSIYDEIPNGIALLNYNQAFGNDTANALLAVATEEYGNSTNTIDKKKLDLLADDSVPKVEVVFLDGYLGTGSYPTPDNPDYGNNYVTMVIAVMHSLSRGKVHITSANVSDTPDLDPGYLSSEHDVKTLISSGKLARKLANTKPLADILVEEYQPGNGKVNTDDEWNDFVRDQSLSFYHLASTCAMLPKEDGGVVDSQLKVWGTKNLRVVDASVIPVLIASHTQTAVYGIAERAAILITESAIIA